MAGNEWLGAQAITKIYQGHVFLVIKWFSLSSQSEDNQLVDPRVIHVMFTEEEVRSLLKPNVVCLQTTLILFIWVFIGKV